jgi:hypothetical protein
MPILTSIHSRKENERRINKEIKQSKINKLYGGYKTEAIDKLKAPSNIAEKALSDLYTDTKRHIEILSNNWANKMGCRGF